MDFPPSAEIIRPARVLKWLEGVCTAAGPAREPVAFAEAFARLGPAAQDTALAKMQALREEIDGLLAVVGR